MSHPKTVDKFIPWSKAMVAGATVDKPHYPGTSRPSSLRKKKRQRATKRRKRTHAKKD